MKKNNILSHLHPTFSLKAPLELRKVTLIYGDIEFHIHGEK